MSEILKERIRTVKDKSISRESSMDTGYYIDNNIIWGPEHSGEYWVNGKCIWGPKNSGEFQISDGRIFGPNNDGEFYIENNHIFGPNVNLPWMK